MQFIFFDRVEGPILVGHGPTPEKGLELLAEKE
jgi:hypothetical protein